MDLEDKIRQALEDTWSFKFARNLTKHETAANVTDLCLDHMDASVAWWTSEVERLKQENEDLQVDLMVAEEMFDATPMTRNGVATSKINIKRRRNFSHEK